MKLDQIWLPLTQNDRKIKDMKKKRCKDSRRSRNLCTLTEKAGLCVPYAIWTFLFGDHDKSFFSPYKI